MQEASQHGDDFPSQQLGVFSSLLTGVGEGGEQQPLEQFLTTGAGMFLSIGGSAFVGPQQSSLTLVEQSSVAGFPQETLESTSSAQQSSSPLATGAGTSGRSCEIRGVEGVA